MNRKERRMNEKMMNVIYNSSPNMLNEKKYVPKNCVFCEVKMKSIHDTHNPYPLADKIVYAKESNKTKTDLNKDLGNIKTAINIISNCLSTSEFLAKSFE